MLPSTGPLTHLRLPTQIGRVDTGVEAGDEVSPYYDPMVAKLIYHAPTRIAAIAGLLAMAGDTECWPVKTNAGFLVQALGDPDFASGRIDTGLIARRGDALLPPAGPSDAAFQGVARRALARATNDLPAIWNQPGLRLNLPVAPVRLRLAFDDAPVEVAITSDALRPVATVACGKDWLVSEGGQTFHLALWRASATHDAKGSGAIHSPMPGLVIAVAVAIGDHVTKGKTLLTLEAMKMEQSLPAPFDGIVVELGVAVGQQVGADHLLVRIEEDA